MISLILFLSTTTILFISEIVSIINYSKMKDIISIPLMEDQFNSPIYSISLAINNQCENNEIQMKLGNFPGTKKGKKQRSKILICEMNCKIKKRAPKNIYIWKNNQFCIKINNELNYESLYSNSVDKDKECDIGFKKCGILDTNNKIMCVEDITDCPINKILINNNSSSPEDYSYKTLKLNNGQYLHYTNESIDSFIVVNLSLSLGIPCSDPLQYNTKYPQYILDNNFKQYICASKYDNTSQFTNNTFISLIDSYRKYDVFKENEILNSIEKLSNYPLFSLNENYDLYSRNYYGIDYKCFNKSKINLFDLHQYDNWEKVAVKTILSFSLIITLTYIISSYVCIFFEIRREFKKCQISSIIILFALVLVCSILDFISYYFLLKIEFNYQCFDYVKKFSMKKEYNRILYNRKLCLINLIFTIISMSTIVFVIFFILMRNRRRNNLNLSL